MAVRAGREVLMGLKYPDAETRRALYASWLRVLASNQWHDSFDGLMLECLAATPSPTTPEQPLFSNMYSVRHPSDGPIPDILAPVLNLGQLPDLFTHEREPVEPLPTSAGFVDYLADLICKGGTSREALDEAGLIIGFCSLALAVAASKPPEEVRAFFRHRLKTALVAAVPTSFNVDMFIPEERFLRKLAFKSLTDSGVIKPYIVLLVLGQYAYHLNAEAAPSADIKFLEEGFLNETKYGRLEVVQLQYAVQEQSGLDAKELNRLIRSHGALRSVIESSSVFAAFLENAEDPMQKTRPWCLVANPRVCLDLDLSYHMDYAIRLNALLAPDPNHRFWHRPEFVGIREARIKESLDWARVFRRYMRNKKNESSAER
ncbi:hypothetical protein V5799_021193 [Amblyomma americanum]|uniref:Uncharacterized protein n=1 Tax=Amblyomma americanum TaxID=6943 RepID=A0AAQ4FQS3_AMBAM